MQRLLKAGDAALLGLVHLRPNDGQAENQRKGHQQVEQKRRCRDTMGIDSPRRQVTA
jgi:hypothetical protein